VPFVVALKGQGIQQHGHDTAVVVAIRGARYQLHLLLVVFVGFCLTNDVLERFLADNRLDNFFDHALRLRRNSLGKLVQ